MTCGILAVAIFLRKIKQKVNTWNFLPIKYQNIVVLYRRATQLENGIRSAWMSAFIYPGSQFSPA